MFIPTTVKETISTVLSREYENAKEIPADHQAASIGEYEDALEWLENRSKQRKVYEIDGSTVETTPADARPGNLYKSPDNGEWRRVISVAMTPGDSNVFTIAGADRDTGEFAGIDFVHDSSTLQLITQCPICRDNQATGKAFFLIDGIERHWLACSECIENESIAPEIETDDH